ncbi:hypothetical protein B0H10DRAFT_2266041 [Mycena sp. CBHHK59/15]|nr:hypothetical protein B0H10DRAFT_2266041 [Mycena sp. CBHHK59/15]
MPMVSWLSYILYLSSEPLDVLYDSLAGSGTSSFSSYQHYSPVSTPIQPQVIEERPHRALAPAPHPSRPAGTAHGQCRADGDVCNITGVQAGTHLRRDAALRMVVGNVPLVITIQYFWSTPDKILCVRAPGVAVCSRPGSMQISSRSIFDSSIKRASRHFELIHISNKTMHKKEWDVHSQNIYQQRSVRTGASQGSIPCIPKKLDFFVPSSLHSNEIPGELGAVRVEVFGRFWGRFCRRFWEMIFIITVREPGSGLTDPFLTSGSGWFWDREPHQNRNHLRTAITDPRTATPEAVLHSKNRPQNQPQNRLSTATLTAPIEHDGVSKSKEARECQWDVVAVANAWLPSAIVDIIQGKQ